MWFAYFPTFDLFQRIGFHNFLYELVEKVHNPQCRSSKRGGGQPRFMGIGLKLLFAVRVSVLTFCYSP